MTPLIHLILQAAFFALGALCAALETAAVSFLRAHSAPEGADMPATGQEARTLGILEKYGDEILVLLMTGRTLGQTAFAVLTVLFFHAHLNPAPPYPLLLGAAAAALPVLLAGETASRALARRFYGPLARLWIPFLAGAARASAFAVRPLLGTLRLLRLARREKPLLLPGGAEDRPAPTGREAAGYREQNQMIANVLELSGRIVREIMRPRTEMVCVEANLPLEKLPDVLRANIKSRLPVIESDKDEIIGVLYIKDLYKHLDRLPELRARDIMRPAVFVPESTPVNSVLRQMRGQRRQLLIVRDAFGGTAGLVTLEDVLEEIVGEIHDEHDRVENPGIRKVAADTFLVSGKTPVYELEEYDIFIHKHSDYDTINGFLQNLLGHIPKGGEEVICENLLFKVLQADGRKVNQVRITRLTADETPEQSN